MPSNYIPRPDSDFQVWQANFITYASANQVALGLTAGNVTSLTTPQTTWNTAYPAHVAAAAAAMAARASKDGSRDALEAAIRLIAQQVQGRSATTEAQRAGLGITIPSGTSSPSPIPSTRPVMTADTSQRLAIKLSWVDQSTPTSKAKPDGVMGAEIYMKIGGTPPADVNDCQFLALDTASPYTVEFAGADANKTAYFISRWVNSRGDRGPISETVAATVTG